MTAARFRSAGSTHQGFVRGNNEDRIHTDDDRGIFLVVDGMGGHAAGEKAAEIAVEHIRARLERQTDSIEQRIREAIALANNAIFSAAQTSDAWRGMACVLTLAVIDNGDAVIGHVGDSRLYRIRNGGIEKITHDHSPVGEREDNGELTEEQAMAHPRRNEVYRDVGSEEHTPDDDDFIEVARIPFEPDSALLLCSDGLSDAIPSARVLEIVRENAGSPQAAVQKLIGAAIEEGKDNVSAVLVAGERFAAPALKHPWWFSAPALLACGALAGACLAAVAMRLFAPPPPQPPRLPVRIRVAPRDARFSTISAAVQLARPGDTIEVAPGEYVEQIMLRTGVALIARDAILRCPTACIAVKAEGVEGARFAGFRIEGDSRHPLDIGLSISSSDVDIERIEVTGARQAAVVFLGAARGILQSSVLHANQGVGVVIEHPAAPALVNNVIRDNGKQPDSLKPGLEILSLTHPLVTGNIFTGNGAEAIWQTGPPDRLMAERNFFLERRRAIRILPAGQR